MSGFSDARRGLSGSFGRRAIALAAIGVMGFSASAALAVNANWYGPAGNWNDPTKWDSGAVPGFGNIVVITDEQSGGVASVVAGDNWTILELAVGNGEAVFGGDVAFAGSGQMLQSGGVINATDWYTVGRFNNNAYSGTVTMTGGVVNKTGGGLFVVTLGGAAASTMSMSGTAVFNNNGPGDTRIGSGSLGGTLNMSETSKLIHTGSEFKVGDGLFNVGHMTMSGSAEVSGDRAMFIGIYGGDGDLTMNNNSKITKTGIGNFAVGDTFNRDEDSTLGLLTMNDDTSIDLTEGTGGVDNEFWVGQGRNGSSTLTLNDNASVHVRNRIQVGRDGGHGTIFINENSKLIHSGTFNGNPTYLELGIFGQNGEGIVNQTGGLLDMQTGGTHVGNDSGSGIYNLSGGTAHFGTELIAGTIGTAAGTINVTGGTGDTASINIGSRAPGTLNVTAGTLKQTNAAGAFTIGDQSSGVVTINAGGVVEAAGYTIVGSRNSSESTETTPVITGVGILNLNAGGTLQTASLRGGLGIITVNFNGGTLKASADETNFIRNLPSFQSEISANGLTIDTNGHAVTLSTALDGAGKLTKSGAGTLTLTVNQANTGGLGVTAGTLKFNFTSGVAKVTSLDLGGTPAAPTGEVDISRKPLVIDYTGATPIDTVRQYLRAGLLGNTGIDYSGRVAGSGIAYAERTFFPGAAPVIFGGTDSTSILLRATLLGDATLDGAVNFDDLLALARKYSATTTGRYWVDGDFDYNGTTDFDDLLSLARNYNGTFPASAAGSAELSSEFVADFALAQSLVPEPTTLGLVAGMAGLLVRRRTAAAR